MRNLKSGKQLAWLRYVESRWGDKWSMLDETTQNALKVAWYAGWSARQVIKVGR